MRFSDYGFQRLLLGKNLRHVKGYFFLKRVSIPWQAEVYWVSVDALDDLKRSSGGR
jgi:hypothetical protein